MYAIILKTHNSFLSFLDEQRPTVRQSHSKHRYQGTSFGEKHEQELRLLIGGKYLQSFGELYPYDECWQVACQTTP